MAQENILKGYQSIDRNGNPIDLGIWQDGLGNFHSSGALVNKYGENINPATQEGLADILSQLVQQNAEPNSANFYNVSFNIAPTNLTTGLNYFVIRNPSATKLIKIKRIVADAFFIGTAVASKSVYALKKFTGVTATTGTVVAIAKRDSSGTNPIADVKQLPTGLVITGVVNADNISHIGHPNQLGASMNKDWQFDNPIVLRQNEALVVQSEGAIVAGSNIVFSVQFYEL